MAERTVLITGATGLLGREVATTFGLKNWNVKGTGYSRADGINTFKVNLSNETEVGEFLDETKPQVLLNGSQTRSIKTPKVLVNSTSLRARHSPSWPRIETSLSYIYQPTTCSPARRGMPHMKPTPSLNRPIFMAKRSWMVSEPS
ncbi:hypothetical protein LB505_010293 [Fusarium chuoi]|nr:hypothetical protein LB505_010293 [Fusarium chuoi]